MLLLLRHEGIDTRRGVAGMLRVAYSSKSSSSTGTINKHTGTVNAPEVTAASSGPYTPKEE